jgi:hypothetical protein
MYYGKADAATTSDGDGTFLFFDDFPGSSLDLNKWIVRTGNVAVSGGELILTGTTGTRGLIDGLVGVPVGSAIHAKSRTQGGGSGYYQLIGLRITNDNNNRAGYLFYETSTATWYFETHLSGVTTQVAVTPVTPGQYSVYQITWKSGESTLYQDDVQLGQSTSNIPTANNVAVFREANAVNSNVYVDWVFIRKFVSPEPAHGTWQNEESGQGALVEVADSLELAETVLRNKTLILSDSLGLAEALYGNKSLLLGDSASLSELVTLLIGEAVKYVIDAVNTADIIHALKTLKTSDTLTLVDAVSTPSRVLKTLEAIGATDNAVVNKVLQITEAVGLAETLEVGVGGVKKTRLFLILGDLAVQLTGD